MTIFNKALPGALNYSIDYAAWLGSDTIATSTWLADTGITIDSDTNDTTSTTVKVSGGSIGITYKLINTVTTTAGLEDRRCLRVNVVECR